MQSADKGSSPKEESSPGKDMSGGLQKVFDTIGKQGKIGADTVQGWLKKAKVTGDDTGITEEDAKKHLPKSAHDKDGGGMDLKEFQQYIETLAKEKKKDSKELMKKLSSTMPSMEKVGEKMGEMKDKLTK